MISVIYENLFLAVYLFLAKAKIAYSFPWLYFWLPRKIYREIIVAFNWLYQIVINYFQKLS